jgi:AcrR family transcriptional regulator
VSANVRTDARRNSDALLAAARESFADHGTDASLRDIARRAGVGIGTLYRHFPTREALLEALLHQGFETLRQRAEALGKDTSVAPRAALVTWLSELTAGSGTYRGVPESVLAALRDETSALHAACAAMRTAGARLLESAQTEATVRPDITADDLLALTAGVAWASEQSAVPADARRRLLTLAIDGIGGHS